jgi:hypothetical protein
LDEICRLLDLPGGDRAPALEAWLDAAEDPAAAAAALATALEVLEPAEGRSGWVPASDRDLERFLTAEGLHRPLGAAARRCVDPLVASAVDPVFFQAEGRVTGHMSVESPTLGGALAVRVFLPGGCDENLVRRYAVHLPLQYLFGDARN